MVVNMVEALNHALHDSMADDVAVVTYGEDVGVAGGVFRVTDKLAERFGASRCFDTPLAESGIVGTAIGMALYGYRPVVEMQFDGFAYPAFDQIVSHLAKMRNRSRGRLGLPIVVRIPFGGGIGGVEHHSESPENLFAHVAGLHVVVPATPSDGYSLLREAIASPDPVIFFEPKRRYWLKEDAALPVTTEPVGTAVVRREGTTASLVSYGATVRTCLEAASAAEEHGWNLEVVDVRTLVPFDADVVVASVKRTGRALVVHEAQTFAGFGAEMAAQVTERAFYHLEAPVQRVCGLDIPYPPAKLEAYHLPDVDRILDTVAHALQY